MFNYAQVQLYLCCRFSLVPIIRRPSAYTFRIFAKDPVTSQDYIHAKLRAVLSFGMWCPSCRVVATPILFSEYFSFPILLPFSLTLGFWTLSIVRNSITRRHNVSETGSVSVLRWRVGGDLLYKEPRNIELRLTLTTGDVKQQEN
jgi:hypothetical protein